MLYDLLILLTIYILPTSHPQTTLTCLRVGQTFAFAPLFFSQIYLLPHVLSLLKVHLVVKTGLIGIQWGDLDKTEQDKGKGKVNLDS